MIGAIENLREYRDRCASNATLRVYEDITVSGVKLISEYAIDAACDDIKNLNSI